MSENKAASKPLPGVLMCSAVLLAGVFYAIRRLLLELSMPTIAALYFAIVALLVWVLGVLEPGRKE